MTMEALFDLAYEITVPPMFVDGDSPRARRTDPPTSHIAADATHAGMKEAKRRVLQLVARQGAMSGTQLNEAYRVHGPSAGWKPLAWDTPRKRASELASDGYLEVSEYAIAAGNHLPEAIYVLTVKGRTVVEGAHA